MGYKKYTKEQELQIVEEYRQGASADDLALKYGFKTRKSITDKVKNIFQIIIRKFLRKIK